MRTRWMLRVFRGAVLLGACVGSADRALARPPDPGDLWPDSRESSWVQRNGAERLDDAVSRARTLVGGDLPPVVVIDPELAPYPAALQGLDAFVVRESDGTLRRRIYVNARSPMVRAAADGVPLALAILAAVLHHEAQHLAGHDEAGARAAEREFFMSLSRRGVISITEATRVLEEFDRQPGPNAHGVARAGVLPP